MFLGVSRMLTAAGGLTRRLWAVFEENSFGGLYVLQVKGFWRAESDEFEPGGKADPGAKAHWLWLAYKTRG